MSMHGANGKGKRKQKGHLAFQVPFLHVLARSHENGTNGGLTLNRKLIGHYNYYGVNGNYRAVRASWWYVKYVKKRLYWTLKRRSQKHRITIEKFGELWSKNIRNPFLPVNIW